MSRHAVRELKPKAQVSYAGQYWFTFLIKWGRGRNRWANFNPKHRKLVMHPSRTGTRATTVNHIPEYLFQEMNLAIYQRIFEGSLIFYEITDTGSERLSGLHSHKASTYYDMVRTVADNLIMCYEMHNIFNEHTQPEQRFMTTSADGDIVVRVGPARMDAGYPQVYIWREDLEHHDRWLLKFLSPLFKEI